jgi:mRNA-degrading endonuclease RelE of RelBE toxin-antitoxin system
MKAKLIIYELKKLEQYHKVLVNRALFGFTDNSNKGSYLYKRGGILSNIPHIRITRGVIVVRNVDGNRVISVLNSHKVKPEVFDITIKQSLLH